MFDVTEMQSAIAAQTTQDLQVRATSHKRQVTTSTSSEHPHIWSLPVEILILIVQHNMPHAAVMSEPVNLLTNGELGGAFPPNWWAPMQVCKSWLSAMRNCPSLWSNLFLSAHGRLANRLRLKAMLSFVGRRCDLSLSADFQCNIQHRSSFQDILLVHHAHHMEHAASLLSFSRGKIARMSQLLVRACGIQLTKLVSQLKQDELPKMQRLALINSSQLGSALPLYANIPNLEELTLTRAGGNWLVFSKSLTLTHLHLEELAEPTRTAEMLQVLGKLIKLRSLRLCAAVVDSRDPDATHIADRSVVRPHLERLHLEEGITLMHEALCCVLAPATCTVCIVHTGYWTGAEVPFSPYIGTLGEHLAPWLSRVCDTGIPDVSTPLECVRLDASTAFLLEAYRTYPASSKAQFTLGLPNIAGAQP